MMLAVDVTARFVHGDVKKHDTDISHGVVDNRREVFDENPNSGRHAVACFSKKCTRILDKTDALVDPRSRNSSHFPPSIVDLIMDALRDERELTLSNTSWRDACYPYRSKINLKTLDEGLKSMSLVQRSWTHPARRSLGESLVVYMGHWSLPSLHLLLRSPLYGPWTRRVCIIELPYAPKKDMLYHSQCWETIRKIVAKTENVESLVVSSQILNASMKVLSTVVPSIGRLKALSLFNGGVGVENFDSLDSICHHLEASGKNSILVYDGRCFSLPKMGSQSSIIRNLTTSHFRNIAVALSSSMCYHIDLISATFSYDSQTAVWMINSLEICSRNLIHFAVCTVRDDEKFAYEVQKLHFVDTATSDAVTCFLQRFTNVRSLTMEDTDSMPLQELVALLPSPLEEFQLCTSSLSQIEKLKENEAFHRSVRDRCPTLKRFVLRCSVSPAVECCPTD